MASPRLTVSVVKQLNLSPRSLQNSRNVRHSLSPRTPDKLLDLNKCKAKTIWKHRVLPFNIDTPNRVKIINNGLESEEKSILGYGGFGAVYKASYKGNQVAVKIIKQRKQDDLTVEAEKHASTLIHPNIVPIFMIERGKIWSLIIMELCDTSLEEKLQEIILNKVERIHILKAIACALQFCHNSGIIHADVKPKNILIASDGQPKLADFGSSILISEMDKITTSLYGTPGYVAPEVIKGRTPCIESDIYSLGILAWRLLSTEVPFRGYHPHTILYLTGRGERPIDNDINDGYHGYTKRNSLFFSVYRRLSSFYMLMSNQV
ncbi:hypothetical protein PV327_011412 [Microctonus hyperodae]|uniref:Protein kinase domain-containing protein n=1 Tax=Microctonus hyperodae TaxID=165561 RepID=A0AA39EZP7_MICHY|nr:hypothetical protein PV327_011412 [Microctonus hyperodae]